MLLVAIFLSGAAGLAYQIAWTRRLVTVTSATATAQAFVLAVFMAGLGLGALLAGRRSARIARPARAYAVIEIAAAALAVASFPIIGASEAARAAFVRMGASAPVGLWLQLGLVSIYLLVPTTLLGATLPLVIEHEERRGAGGRARIVPALYGLNTLGATAGCLAAGFVSVERLGLVRTAAAGGLLAIAAAAIAVIASRHDVAAKGAPEIAPEAGAPPPRWLHAAAGLAGFVGLGAEIVWTRLFALIIPNTVYTFTQVLAAVLIGIALGSVIAGAAARRTADVTRAAAIAAAIAVVLMGAVPLAVVRFAGDIALQKQIAGGRSLVAAATLLACLVPASALLAAVLPLLAVAGKGERAAGSFGSAYAANIAGSVLGSLVTGFVLIPGLGVKGAGAVLEIAGLGVAVLLLAGAGKIRAAMPLVGPAAAAAFLLHLGHHVPQQIYEGRLDPGIVIRDVREGASSHVMVTDDPRRGGERRLWINSFWVAGSTGPHRAFGHLPALFSARPKRVLGIALGTGQTFAATLKHGAEHLDCVEIDEGVVDLSRRWFGEVNDGLLGDPRVSVHVEDGRTFLRAATAPYDVIVLEPLQAWSAGTSSLYSREFYEEARRALAPSGVLAQWIPFYGQGPDETRAMVRTGLEVFGRGTLWLAGHDGVLVLPNGPADLPLGALDKRIAERDLAADLLRLPARSAIELVPFVLLGTEGLRRWTDGAAILVDDRPLLEFRAASYIGATNDSFRDILRSALPHLDDLRPAITDAADVPAARLDAALALRKVAAEIELLPDDDNAGWMLALEGLPEAAHGIPRWRTLYKDAMRRWLEAPSTEAGGLPAAAAIYERVLAHDPRMGEALVNLALTYRRMGREADARAMLKRAADVPSVREAAERLLAEPE